MSGLPGSGKSKYAQHLVDTEFPRALILSSDDIRDTMAIGADWKGNAEKHIRDVIAHYARGCLIYGRDVIIDSTNLTKNHRTQMAWYALEYGQRAECHFIRVKAAESARRSAKWIPNVAIGKLAKTFEYPELSEGFHKLVTVDGEDGWKVVDVKTGTPGA